MAKIALWLIGILVEAIGPALGRWLVGMGIGVVAYTGLLVLFNSLKASAFGYLDQAHVGLVGQWLGLFRVGQCFNILFSAVLVRMTLRGLASGTVKKWVTK